MKNKERDKALEKELKDIQRPEEATRRAAAQGQTLSAEQAKIPHIRHVRQAQGIGMFEKSCVRIPEYSYTGSERD